MSIIDKLSDMNIDFNLHIKKTKSKKGSNKFTDKKLSIAGTKVVIKEITAYRKEMKLPKLVLKIRQCLMCFDKFHSAGSHNRMCDNCAQS